ncbi:S-adenosylmethionine-dependent methyltransferase [Sporothrix epigloea]|uniref:tRNA(Phe) (4-demethylwyosine(37)-C(7)) aminocarboxypropyltransferase n=1 Tax=Sporothrix epigloea TaxID=1892477 RepID=A0ABP0D2N1_9PEZI
MSTGFDLKSAAESMGEAVAEMNQTDKINFEAKQAGTDTRDDSTDSAVDEIASPPLRHGRAHAKDGRPKKPKAESKLATVVRQWLDNVLPTLPDPSPWAVGSVSLMDRNTETLVAQAPKRWVVYEPMVLLPTGSFSTRAEISVSRTETSSARLLTSPAPLGWPDLLAAVSREQQDQLWRGILLALSPKGASGVRHAQLTHLAVNEGIPPQNVQGGDNENILRSPTGLRPLYGDFGPAATLAGGPPTDADFERAFWVSTKQNGLYQTWAPRWSMFSRGNIKEKARLLAWSRTACEETTGAWAVDLYAGIGYFVFSYAQRGLRVLGWELNPWSAEALRRGAVRNGWSVRVVRRDVDLARPTAEAVFSGRYFDEGNSAKTVDKDKHDKPPVIVIFVEDNQHAARRLSGELQAFTASLPAALSAETFGPVVHVNCGLLPTSRPTWQIAWAAIVGGADRETSTAPRTGWMHLHDNVGVEELASRQAEIQALVTAWAGEVAETRQCICTAVVEHVEQVKTFAPGVWHCVFDVRITI